MDTAKIALSRWAGSSPHRPLRRGTVIRVKPLHCDAVVVSEDLDNKVVNFYSDSGPGACMRNELSVYRKQPHTSWKPMRLFLPYGKWKCSDGTEVLFNRNYKPMWARNKNREMVDIQPNAWVNYENQSWYFGDHNAPWDNRDSFNKCVSELQKWGVSEKLPKTLTDYYELMRTGVKLPTNSDVVPFPSLEGSRE